MRRLRLLLLVSIALASAACGGSAGPPSAAASPPAKTQNTRPETELALVTLSPEAEAHLALETLEVALRPIAPTRTLGGEVIVPPGRAVAVTAPVPGALGVSTGRKALVGPVRRGQAIFELMPLQQADRDLGAEAEREAKQSEARLAEARQRLERLESLLAEGSTSARAVEEARAGHVVALAAAEAARRRLEATARLPVGPRGEISIAAPFDGVVTAVHAAAGQTVAAGTPLFDVTDAASIWIRVPVYAGEVRALDPTRTAAVAELGRESSGPWAEIRRVTGPLVANAAAASVDLYFESANGDAAFTPGQRVAVRLPLRAAASERGIAVPQSAVIYDINGGAWVYAVQAPHVYARRRVEIAGQIGSSAIVSRGLDAGARIVTVGAAELYGTEFFVSK